MGFKVNSGAKVGIDAMQQLSREVVDKLKQSAPGGIEAEIAKLPTGDQALVKELAARMGLPLHKLRPADVADALNEAVAHAAEVDRATTFESSASPELVQQFQRRFGEDAGERGDGFINLQEKAELSAVGNKLWDAVVERSDVSTQTSTPWYGYFDGLAKAAEGLAPAAVSRAEEFRTALEKTGTALTLGLMQEVGMSPQMQAAVLYGSLPKSGSRGASDVAAAIRDAMSSPGKLSGFRLEEIHRSLSAPFKGLNRGERFDFAVKGTVFSDAGQLAMQVSGMTTARFLQTSGGDWTVSSTMNGARPLQSFDPASLLQLKSELTRFREEMPLRGGDQALGAKIDALLGSIDPAIAAGAADRASKLAELTRLAAG